MKIEISHDTLAKAVFDRASSDDRMRLRVASLIKAKYELNKERNTFLSGDELKFIAPFENRIILSDGEKRFVGRSKFYAKRQMFALGVIIVNVVIILIWLSMSYRQANMQTVKAHFALKEHFDALNEKKDSIANLLEYLVEKDSTQQVLRESIKDRETVINMTNSELQNVLKELQVANEELKKKTEELRIERDKLHNSNIELATRLKNTTAESKKAMSALSADAKSQKLSRQAQQLLSSSKNPSEEQYKQAFRMARAAWEMKNSNSQAMDILNEIKNKKLKQPSGGFLSATQPEKTYTYSKIKEMIRRLDSRYNYGKLSNSEINQLLR